MVTPSRNMSVLEVLSVMAMPMGVHDTSLRHSSNSGSYRLTYLQVYSDARSKPIKGDCHSRPQHALITVCVV